MGTKIHAVRAIRGALGLIMLAIVVVFGLSAFGASAHQDEAHPAHIHTGTCDVSSVTSWRRSIR